MRPATLTDVEYPESDGEPMGETAIHVAWTMRLLQLFSHRYAGERTLTGANLIFYYVDGEPSRNVCPDVFVVKDCEPGHRRTFLVWKEKRVPNVVFELTSRSTQRRDEAFKPKIYAELGVAEYFLYDPTADYLDPPLQGHRLGDAGYVRIEPDAEGRLESRELGAHLRLDGLDLELRDTKSGDLFLTEAEAASAAAATAWSDAEAARANAEAERASRERAEAEVARLRARLAELGDDAD